MKAAKSSIVALYIATAAGRIKKVAELTNLAVQTVSRVAVRISVLSDDDTEPVGQKPN